MSAKHVLQGISVEPVALFGAAIYMTHLVGLPQLLTINACKSKFNDTFCQKVANHPYEENTIQQESALWIAALYGLSYSISLFVMYFIGSSADRRKKSRVMIIIPLLTGLQSSVYLGVSWRWKTIPPWVLLFGTIWTGLFGEFQGIILLRSAYLIKETPIGDRSMRLLILECVNFAGYALASPVTGFLLDRTGLPSVFLFTLVLSILNFLYIRIHLWNKENPELEAEPRNELIEPSKNADHEKGSKSGTLSMLCSSLLDVFEPKIRTPFFLLLFALALAFATVTPEPTVETFYLKRHPFKLTASKLGLTFLFQNIIRAFGTSFLNFFLNVRFQVSDIFSVCLGFVTQAVFCLSMGLVKDTKAVIPLQILSIGFPLITAGIRSMISKLVEPSRSGTVLGVAQSLDSVAALLSMVIMNGVYAESVFWDSGSAFYVFTGNAIVGTLVLLVYKMFYGSAVNRELYSEMQ